MFDINALRLTWGRAFLVDRPDSTDVSQDKTTTRAYVVDVQLLPGWYMVEIRLDGQATERKARIKLSSASSPESLAMSLNSRQVSKRLIYLPARERIEIEVDSQGPLVERIETFRLARVTSRFARSRMTAKLEALHPKYRSCGNGYDVTKVSHDHRDLPKAWRDYCRLFDESEPLASYQDWIYQFDTLSADTRRAMLGNLRGVGDHPVFAIGIEVGDVSTDHLETAILSVVGQIYPHWWLIIEDRREGAEDKLVLPSNLRSDARISIISGNGSSDAPATLDRKLAEWGEWITYLGPEDVLPEHALYVLADAIRRDPDVDLIYADEDSIDAQGTRHSPRFKSDWNDDLGLSSDLFTGLAVYRTGVFTAAGGRDPRHGSASRFDMTLRCLGHTSGDRILHIPRVLYHGRAYAEAVNDPVAQKRAREAGRQAVERHLSRIGAPAVVFAKEHGHHVQYAVPEKKPLVSLIIPTRNGFDLLSRCVDSIIEKTRYRAFEIIIVDNGSDDRETLAYMAKVSAEHGVRVIRDDSPFNYSALNNRAVQVARGQFVALVNNDVEVSDGGWLDEVMGNALRPEVGVVGVKLLFTNGTVQHAGVIIGLSGCADHLHRGLPGDAPGYMARAAVTQSLSAVTGACLVVRRSLYEQVGGLNERDLAVSFNDVDFCLRVRQAGYTVLWTPHAVLYHHESATRGGDDTPEKVARATREADYIRRSWGDLIANDPAYNPNLSLHGFDCRLAWPPRTESLRQLAQRI
ncbi:glycosyltransferase family 2 protein [Paraburkholderia bannensis]|uniref:glycosyltransferase family 2 protein n=1 Tax=Paraburkholderia bannensis TaxID=765414 RepID=UPI002AB6FE8F|nr:glycosyltransferase family 2 protein [Paraburkholderia bannensis]